MLDFIGGFMKMSELLTGLITRFGKENRVYSVSFDDLGFWHIGVTDTSDGEIIASYSNANVATHTEN
jgi:hypothetical protein